MTTLVALLGGASSKQIYEHAKTDVSIYTQLNFEKQVTKNRDKGISVVHFYKSSDAGASDFVNSYKDFATENMGVFRIGSVDCEDFQKICEKEKVTETPTLKVYPPFPAPTQDMDLAKGFDSKAIKKFAGRFYTDKSIEITSNNHKTFVEDQPGTPKVLLFTNAKKGTPFVYKALSQNFEKTLHFGLVRESEDALAKKYKVKKFPALVVVKSEGKPITYDGAQFTYQPIFEFLNVHSQIFVDPRKADNQPTESAASRPWLTVAVPQITAESGNDICLQKDGALCVILVAKDKSQASSDVLEIMNSVGQGFASKISRGISFYFSWLDTSAEPEFAATFGLPEEDLPKIVVMNPGKRKRFMLHEGEISEAGIEGTLDKILGGDARFKAVKGNKLPKLVSEYPKE
eukprot:CAMPEP_0170493486 /NCGR_PEP_ID=MMETSP0208-20121228/13968_1 /TAXON_ID=197538 /ORGANISM="Strombidium inclinatum, Strain S3" /LENGTH=401 /DNA_ID=CAMNT_0010769419 /DNA_START=30 /DNA_END=1235 /DNA_ORIENTATION=+